MVSIKTEALAQAIQQYILRGLLGDFRVDGTPKLRPSLCQLNICLYKQTSTLAEAIKKMMFGGPFGASGWLVSSNHVKIFFILIYLLIKKMCACLIVQKVIFGGSIWGVSWRMLPPNCVKIFAS